MAKYYPQGQQELDRARVYIYIGRVPALREVRQMADGSIFFGACCTLGNFYPDACANA